MSSSTIIDTTSTSPSIQSQQNVPATQNTSTGQSVTENEENIVTDAVLIDISESMNTTTFSKDIKN